MKIHLLYIKKYHFPSWCNYILFKKEVFNTKKKKKIKIKNKVLMSHQMLSVCNHLKKRFFLHF